MKKFPRRRFSDLIRALADKASERGSKEVSDDLHSAARKEEATLRHPYRRRHEH